MSENNINSLEVKPNIVSEERFDPYLQVIAFCENIIKDELNKYSLINIFDRVFVDEMPSFVSIKAFFSMMVDKGKYMLCIRAIAPDNKQTELPKYEFEKDVSGMHSVTMFLNLSFRIYGYYIFEFYINDKYITKIGLTVSKLDKPGE